MSRSAASPPIASASAARVSALRSTAHQEATVPSWSTNASDAPSADVAGGQVAPSERLDEPSLITRICPEMGKAITLDLFVTDLARRDEVPPVELHFGLAVAQLSDDPRLVVVGEQREVFVAGAAEQVCGFKVTLAGA